VLFVTNFPGSQYVRPYNINCTKTGELKIGRVLGGRHLWLIEITPGIFLGKFYTSSMIKIVTTEFIYMTVLRP
jgi:hypothetical protein